MIFVLGSHVRHIGVGARTTIFGKTLDPAAFGMAWVPLCGQRAATPWRIAATPAQNARDTCALCIRKARKIVEVVL